MKYLKSWFLLSIFLFIFWILLAGTDVQELIVGLAVSILISSLLVKKISVFDDIRISLKAFICSLIYIFIFMVELVKSNFDVAFRVLHPKLPINPGIVKVRTKLKSKLGRIILANSITLTPGTLTVEIQQDYYYIHWIDVTAEDIDRSTELIVKKFEKYLEVIFG